MIYGDKILEEIYNEYLNNSKDIEIIIGNDIVLDEDVQLKTNNKSKFEINIRSKYQGGRSGAVINHGPALKVRFDREFIDLFIVKSGDKYKCEIDDHKSKKEQDTIKRDKNYKTAKKFIERNGQDLVNAWNSHEDDDIFKESIENIKEREPQFIYKKSGGK